MYTKHAGKSIKSRVRDMICSEKPEGGSQSAAGKMLKED
jgi:hypothetical protein